MLTPSAHSVFKLWGLWRSFMQVYFRDWVKHDIVVIRDFTAHEYVWTRNEWKGDRSKYTKGTSQVVFVFIDGGLLGKMHDV